jgi:hypothetical protein
VTESRGGAGRYNWEYQELELSDAEQESSVLRISFSICAGVSLNSLLVPKNFMFGQLKRRRWSV